MPTFTTSDGVSLFYTDWGTGRPVVLLHGWPLSSAFWEYQSSALVAAGYRVIAPDKRGFGRSDQPWDGYDYDRLADDIAELVDHLDLHDATLVGFSMGGGEVARYLSRHGTTRVAQAALVAAVTPILLKTADNPEGIDRAVFDELVAGIEQDRPGYLVDFAKGFFNVGNGKPPVSQGILDWYLQLAMQASPRATIACARAWSETDFRADMAAFTVPTLILHGAQDVNVAPATTSRPAARMIAQARYIEYADSGHAIIITDAERVTADLLMFFKEAAG
ncbi:alpha/beta fold hydrolase [Sphingomonas abietis]|uniref:Alpha/beta hydrolase n=1 Tax=Sphingomonas abietis TaxID=3012344 RepID=A0ABY7NJD1_9SPHN|nr:alpha/beta hydrolase [Sphingomonas abietis]WBO20707.1 alpha/beta hydrolase [Sphingomonas abietis]